jgi:hypothetical protein
MDARQEPVCEKRPGLPITFTITFRLFIYPIYEEHDIINFSNDLWKAG